MWRGFPGVPSVSGPRMSPQELKTAYRQLADLLNKLERQGEELVLWDTEDRREITGSTARVYKYSPNYPGNWSVE